MTSKGKSKKLSGVPEIKRPIKLRELLRAVEEDKTALTGRWTVLCVVRAKSLSLLSLDKGF